jgi:hypothetical protein
MAQNRTDPDDIVAIKCIDKKALRGKEDSLENEIRVLRRFVGGPQTGPLVARVCPPPPAGRTDMHAGSPAACVSSSSQVTY